MVLLLDLDLVSLCLVLFIDIGCGWCGFVFPGCGVYVMVACVVA